MTMAARTIAVQPIATSKGRNHPAINAAIARGGDSERRKLSSIFQRATAGMAARARLPCDIMPKIHGRSCQSPRVQR